MMKLTQGKLKLGGVQVKRELGIARCGLACCLCTENIECNGCGSNGCPDNHFCEIKDVPIAKRVNTLL